MQGEELSGCGEDDGEAHFEFWIARIEAEFREKIVEVEATKAIVCALFPPKA